MKGGIIAIIVCFTLVLTAGCATTRIQVFQPVYTEEGELIPQIKIEPPGKEFPTGEKLVYGVSYLGVKVGEVVLWIKELPGENNHQEYHFVLTARTNKIFSTIYRVDDELYSFVEKNGFLPRRFERHLQHRRRYTRLIVDFDQENGQVNYFSGTDTWSRKVEGKPQDPLSALYYFRSHEMAVGETISYQVSTGKNHYQLEAQILNAGRLTLPQLGTYSAVLVEPTARENGVMIQEGRAWFWISADSRRIPLVGKLKAFALGTIIARLERIEEQLGDNGEVESRE